MIQLGAEQHPSIIQSKLHLSVDHLKGKFKFSSQKSTVERTTTCMGVCCSVLVPKNLETVVEPEASVELTPMEMDDVLHHSIFEDQIDTGDDPNVGEHVDDEETYGDEPDEPGMSDKDEEGEAHSDQKEMRWKPPTLEAAQTAHAKIKAIIHPPWNTGKGYKDPGLDLLLRSWL